MDKKEFKKIWESFEDVPFDENKEGELVLAHAWYLFPKGTSREEIWHYFEEEFGVIIGEWL